MNIYDKRNAFSLLQKEAVLVALSPNESLFVLALVVAPLIFFSIKVPTIEVYD